MSRSDDVSTLFLNGSGDPKITYRQGVVESWDELSGANTILIGEQPFDDVRVLSTGAVTPFQPGDVVGVQMVGTSAYIQGKVRAVGAGLGERIASDKNVDGPDIPLNTDYADLSGSFGPQVSIFVGSARRVLVIHSCAVSIPTGSSETYRGTAFQGVQISGATNILPSEAVYDCFFQGPPNSIQALTSTTLLTEADGLNQGLNTFTCKYMAYKTGDIASVSAYNRVLTVIPV